MVHCQIKSRYNNINKKEISKGQRQRNIFRLKENTNVNLWFLNFQKLVA